MGRSVLASCLLILFFGGQEISADVPVPPLKARVTDLTQTLSDSEKTELEFLLQDYQKEKGSQIAVLIVPTTKPQAIEQYSIRVAEAWKLGRKGVDDGVLLLIAKDDHTLRLEVGYGLEGALSDAYARRIVSDVIVPYFKNNDFFGGIKIGLQSVIATIKNEPLPATKYKPEPRLFDSPGEWFLENVGNLIMAFIAALILAILDVIVVAIGVRIKLLEGATQLIGLGLFAALVFLAGFFFVGVWWMLGIVIVMTLLAAYFTFSKSSSSDWSSASSSYSSDSSSSSSSGSGSSSPDGFSGGGGNFGGGGASGTW